MKLLRIIKYNIHLIGNILDHHKTIQICLN